MLELNWEKIKTVDDFFNSLSQKDKQIYNDMCEKAKFLITNERPPEKYKDAWLAKETYYYLSLILNKNGSETQQIETFDKLQLAMALAERKLNDIGGCIPDQTYDKRVNDTAAYEKLQYYLVPGAGGALLFVICGCGASFLFTQWFSGIVLSIGLGILWYIKQLYYYYPKKYTEEAIKKEINKRKRRTTL